MSREFEVLTLFPAAIEGFVAQGLLGKAIEAGRVAVRCTDLRAFANDRHRTVDDAPFGGGAGMVIKPEPVVAALEAIEAERGPMHRILLTPSAPRFDQRVAERLATLPRIGLLCGRYEGIDDRVREHFVHECLSLGDFVLGGGEVAALAIIESVARLVEGVMGNPDSAVHESFADGGDGQLLEYPQFTRPAEFRGHRVPEVLMRGDHAEIERWRRAAAHHRTWSLRPDLRPRRAWPEDAPIHLAVGAAVDVQIVVDLARRHRVDGVFVLDPGDHDSATATPMPTPTLDAWTSRAAGRPPVAAVADLRTARKRLRRGAGTDPWVVALAQPEEPREVAHPPRPGLTPVRSASELMDALGGAQPGSVQRRPLLLLWPDLPDGTVPPDAVFAPRLAIPTVIADVSHPAAAVDRALSELRPTPPEDSERDVP